MPDPVKNTYLTIKHNGDGSKIVTNAIVVDADEVTLAHTLPAGVWIGWTFDVDGEWKAPAKPETQEEENVEKTSE
jgi:hypothetical protein